MGQPYVRCTVCQKRTQSVTALCARHRAKAKPRPAPRPIVPCVSCGSPTRSALEICSPCQKHSNRPKLPCTECGSPTRAATGMCGLCQNGHTQDGSPYALLDGHWRTRGGVKVWVAA